MRRSKFDHTVRAVIIEGFFTRLGFGMVTFALPLYALHLGMSLTEVGLIAGAKALVEPAVKPLMGIVVDRFGIRRAYLAAVILRAFAALLLPFVTTTAGLLAVRFLQGAASAARDPASITVIAKSAHGRLGRTFSAAIAARDIGNVSAGLIGGGVLAATGGSFTALWVLVIALALVPVAIVWTSVRDLPDPRPSSATARPAAATQAPVRILSHPTLRLVAGLGFFAGLTAHMTHALFQVYATEVAGLAAGQVGLIYSLSIATLLFIGPIAGWIADRYGNGLLASLRGVANAASSFIYLLFPALGGVLIGRLVDDAGKAAFRPTWGSLVATATREAGPNGGRVAGKLDAALSFGEALGPLVAALLWDVYGIVAFFSVRAALGVATEVFFGRRLRSGLRSAGMASSPDGFPVLLPGAGRLTFDGVCAGEVLDGCSAVVEPRKVTAIVTATRSDAEVLKCLAGGLRAPERGSVLLDGQDLYAHGPSSARRASAEVSPHVPPGVSSVGALLTHRFAAPPFEDLARAWKVCVLNDQVGPVDAVYQRPLSDYDITTRRRMAVAASLVGDPALIVVDESEPYFDLALLSTIDAVVGRHLGSVLILNPRPERLKSADVVFELRSGRLHQYRAGGELAQGGTRQASVEQTDLIQSSG